MTFYSMDRVMSSTMFGDPHFFLFVLELLVVLAAAIAHLFMPAPQKLVYKHSTSSSTSCSHLESCEDARSDALQAEMSELREKSKTHLSVIDLQINYWREQSDAATDAQVQLNARIEKSEKFCAELKTDNENLKIARINEKLDFDTAIAEVSSVWETKLESFKTFWDKDMERKLADANQAFEQRLQTQAIYHTSRMQAAERESTTMIHNVQVALKQRVAELEETVGEGRKALQLAQETLVDKMGDHVKTTLEQFRLTLESKERPSVEQEDRATQTDEAQSIAQTSAQQGEDPAPVLQQRVQSPSNPLRKAVHLPFEVSDSESGDDAATPSPAYEHWNKIAEMQEEASDTEQNTIQESELLFHPQLPWDDESDGVLALVPTDDEDSGSDSGYSYAPLPSEDSHQFFVLHAPAAPEDTPNKPTRAEEKKVKRLCGADLFESQPESAPEPESVPEPVCEPVNQLSAISLEPDSQLSTSTPEPTALQSPPSPPKQASQVSFSPQETAQSQGSASLPESARQPSSSSQESTLVQESASLGGSAPRPSANTSTPATLQGSTSPKPTDPPSPKEDMFNSRPANPVFDDDDDDHASNMDVDDPTWLPGRGRKRSRTPSLDSSSRPPSRGRRDPSPKQIRLTPANEFGGVTPGMAASIYSPSARRLQPERPPQHRYPDDVDEEAERERSIDPNDPEFPLPDEDMSDVD